MFLFRKKRAMTEGGGGQRKRKKSYTIKGELTDNAGSLTRYEGLNLKHK